MHITYLSIFPELFDSFIETTLITRAVSQGLLSFETINPRHFCDDKHRLIDDKVYGWGHGMLMKATPIIDSIQHRLKKHNLKKHSNKSKRHIIIPHPSKTLFCQEHAHSRSENTYILFICGRYEWIDERVWIWLNKYCPWHISKVSLWQFVTLGGELPAMTMTEAIVRLIPGVINTEMSRIDESYSIKNNMNNIEYPQYTRPQLVENMEVPEVLLSWNHKAIKQRKQNHASTL